MEYVTFTKDEIKYATEFAHNMKGNHAENNRTDLQIFGDDLRGKLGEIAVHKLLSNSLNSCKVSSIDYSIYPRGVWDTCDISIHNLNSITHNIDVKTVKHYSKNLMIECDRFNTNGEYIYKNTNGSQTIINSYILVKINIADKLIVSSFYNTTSFITVENCMIKGVISSKKFWNHKKYIPKGILCSKINTITNSNMTVIIPTVNSTDNRSDIVQHNNFAVHENNLSPISSLIKYFNEKF